MPLQSIKDLEELLEITQQHSPNPVLVPDCAVVLSALSAMEEEAAVLASHTPLCLMLYINLI